VSSFHGAAQILTARLLPQERWSRCARCEAELPEFEFSEQFQLQLTESIDRGNSLSAIMQLSRVFKTLPLFRSTCCPGRRAGGSWRL